MSTSRNAPALYLESLFSLKGKTAVVTGGTRGIGQEIAIALAGAGANIVLVQRNAKDSETVDRIKALWTSLNDKTSNPRFVQVVECDMADPNKVAGVVDRVTKPTQNGGLGLDIDILVNCAGITKRHPAEDYPDNDWEEVMQVNLNAVWVLARNTGKHMLERRAKHEAATGGHSHPLPHGKIINIASLLSYQGGILSPPYASSKHAVTGLTKALANEWSSKGINVNCIVPGYIATDMNEALIADPTRSRQILERIPAGRWGSSADFAGPTVFLASAGSDYVCGEALVVDGGWMGR